MPAAMTDIKAPAPVRVECRYAMCTSGEKVELECLQCYLVGYCSEACAMKDRNEHSEFCQRHQSRMGVDYDPKKDLDRFLSGLDEKPYPSRADKRTSGQVPVSRLGHPKLITTETPASFCLGYIDRTLGTKVNILTEGLGDLYIFIDSFLELPSGSNMNFFFQIKEAHEITVLRNLVLLLMAFDSTNFIRTAEAMVHYWYSAFLPPSVFHFLQGSVAHYLHQMKQGVDQSKYGQNETVKATYQCREADAVVIATSLPKRVWTNSEYLKVSSSAFTPSDYAAVQSKRYQNIRSRRQEIERGLADPSKPPEWRTSRVNFLETGLLLPISTSRSNYTCPNPSFFRSGNHCFDYGDDRLQIHEQFELAGSFNSAKNDRHGQLFFHIRERLVRFICKLKSFRGNVEVHMFTDKGAEKVQFPDPDLRWPPVATQPSISATPSLPTATDKGEEKQPVLDETDSDTSSGLFVKDNSDSGLSTAPDGDGSSAEMEPLVGTKSTTEEPGKQDRRLTKGQKKKAALARKKAVNANAAAQKSEHLARLKQEAPTSNANAKWKPAWASGSQLESTETETATKQQPRAAHNAVSSWQEATDSAIDSEVDGESKSMTEQPQHTRLTRAAPRTAPCSSRTPSTPQTCASISTGAQKHHGIGLSPNDNITSPSIDTPPQSSSSAGQGKEPPAPLVSEDLGSGQPSVVIEDALPSSTATPGGEPGTEKTPPPDKQSHNATPCTGLAATMASEQDLADKGKSSSFGHNDILACRKWVDAIERVSDEFQEKWWGCVDAGTANVDIWLKLVDEVHEDLENDPQLPPMVWKILENHTIPSSCRRKLEEAARSGDETLTTDDSNELAKLCDIALTRGDFEEHNRLSESTGDPFQSHKLASKALVIVAWREFYDNIHSAYSTATGDIRDNDASEQVTQSSGAKKKKKDAGKEAARKRKSRKEKAKRQREAQGGNPPGQTSQTNEAPEQATEASGSCNKATKAEDTPKQETQISGSSKQPTKTGDTVEQATQASDSSENATKAKETSQQATRTGDTPEQETQPSSISKKATQTEDTSQQPTKTGGTPKQETQPSGISKQATQTEDTSQQPSKTGGTPKQKTQPSGSPRRPSKTGDTLAQATQSSGSSKKSTKASKDVKKASKTGKASEKISENSKNDMQLTNTGELVKQVPKANDESKQVSQQPRVLAKCKGKDYDITGTDIDLKAFEAYPENIQEEVLASHKIEPEPDWTTVQRKKDTGKGKEVITPWRQEPAKRTTQDKKPLVQQKEVKGRGQDKETESGTKHIETKASEQNASKVAASYIPSQPPQVPAWNNPRKPWEVAASSNPLKPPRETKPQAAAWEKSTKPLQVAASDKRTKSPSAAASNDPPEPPQAAASNDPPEPPQAAASNDPPEPPQAAASTNLPPSQVAVPDKRAKSSPAAASDNLPEPLQTAASNDTPTRDSERRTPVVDTPPSDTRTLYHESEQPQNPEAPGGTVAPKNDESTGSQFGPLFDVEALRASEALLALQQGSTEPQEPEELRKPEGLPDPESYYRKPGKLGEPGRRTVSDPGVSFRWDGELREPEESKQSPVSSKASPEGFESNNLPTNKVSEASEQLQPAQQISEKLHGLEQPGKAAVPGSDKSGGFSGYHGPEHSQESGTTSQGPISARLNTEFTPEREEPFSSAHEGFEQYVPQKKVVVRIFDNTSRPYSATPNDKDGNIEATTQAEAKTQTNATTQTEATTQAEATTQTEATMQINATTQTEATMLAEATMQTEATPQNEATIQTEPTMSEHLLARMALEPLQQAIPKEGVPKHAWGRVGLAFALSTHYAFQLATVVDPGQVTSGTSAPVRTGAVIRPGNTLEDIPDYEKSHYVSRAEELGDEPVRAVPWSLEDWQEHMERTVENPRDIQGRGHA